MTRKLHWSYRAKLHSVSGHLALSVGGITVSSLIALSNSSPSLQMSGGIAASILMRLQTGTHVDTSPATASPPPPAPTGATENNYRRSNASEVLQETPSPKEAEPRGRSTERFGRLRGRGRGRGRGRTGAQPGRGVQPRLQHGFQYLSFVCGHCRGLVLRICSFQVRGQKMRLQMQLAPP